MPDNPLAPRDRAGQDDCNVPGDTSAPAIPRVVLTADPLDPRVTERAVSTDQDGALVCFTGVVRDHSRGRSVVGLEYQAYEPMARRQMEQIVAEVRERWGLACAIHHRFGRVNVGEIAIVVAVASPHRAEAFDACRWAIDTVKNNVPIWKKEFTADGGFWIEGDDALPVEG